MSKKIGIIARCDNRGLGIQTWEFYKHIEPFKILIVIFDHENNHPERYEKGNVRICKEKPDQSDLNWLLGGIDVLVVFETVYSSEVLSQAKQRGIATIMQPNWEWFDEKDRPDLLIPPSLWHFEDYPDPKIYLPAPVNRDLIPFKLREKAKVFLHNAGNMQAGYDRNGTKILFEAIPLVKSDVKFIIKSQIKIEGSKDGRIEMVCDDKLNYWEQWQTDADVLLYPRRYGGLSLPLNEAMSAGLVPIMIDCDPVNRFLPKELLIKPNGKEELFIRQKVESYSIMPDELAKKIDEIANKDITKFSKISDHIAENWSWTKLKSKYLRILNKI